MARAAYVVLCLAGMIGFALLVTWGGQHFSREGVIAYALGFMSALILYYGADKVDRRHRDRA
jgi:hypothetical protein